MFSQIYSKYKWDEVSQSIYNKTSQDVERALHSTKRNLDDFLALISPAALPYLELIAQESNRLTQKRFGKTIQMYIPMYLSNECQNVCTYCGFSITNKIPRKTLTEKEIFQEVEYIKSCGYDHILLVTGEDNVKVGVDYIEKVVQLVRPHFSSISIEVQPLQVEGYKRLKRAGVNTVLVYQETYNQLNYQKYHSKGRKSNFENRLETHDRLGKAEIHKMGLGVLLGLEDWRVDSFFAALHLDYLEKKYWKSKYSISFPRLRPCSGEMKPNIEMSDKDLVQLICAYRLLNEELEISISTRESETFRNNIIQLGATTFSAESRTNPGGYVVERQSLEQFEVSDERSTKEVASIIKNSGYEPVWKDWEEHY